MSEIRPESARQSSHSKFNDTMTSNQTIETVDLDDLKQQLAATTFELEEQQASLKKQLAKQQKEIEQSYEEVELQKLREKQMRVKINQIENDLEHQLRRLAIICKSKGLAKPKRPDCLPETPQRRSTNYVSPYRATKNTPSATGSANRNLSNGSGGKVYTYTPPNKRNISTGSAGSGKSPALTA